MPQNSQTRDDHKCALAAEILRRAGTVTICAFGTSMLPIIWPGDILTIEHTSDLAAGDIGLVARDGRFFVHRLLRVEGENCIFRGDVLRTSDPIAVRSQILGKVTEILSPHRRTSRSPKLTLVKRWLGLILGQFDSLRNAALRFHCCRRLDAASASCGAHDAHVTGNLVQS